MIRLSLLLALAYCAVSRVTEQAIKPSAFKREDGWVYLDKMVLAQGTINIEFETRVVGQIAEQIELDFAIISDQHFQTESKHRCSNPEQNSQTQSHILPPSNKLSATKIKIDNDKEQLYYFVLKDCKKQLYDPQKVNTQITILTKLTIINAGSHLGNEEDMWFIYPLIILSSFWLVFQIDRQKPMQGQKNWLQIILFLGILARISGLFWRGTGFILYYMYGKHYTIFEIFYLGMHGLSQVMIICIIVLLGFGWYILFVNHKYFDVFLSFLALLGTLNVVLNILNVINNDAPEKYHMYDTVPSIIQTVFRVFALISLLVGIMRTWKRLSPDRRLFIVKFSIYGAVYILSLPITLLLARLISRSQQQELVFLISQVFQLSSNILMTYLLTAKSSSYSKANIENDGFLPVQQNQKFF